MLTKEIVSKHRIVIAKVSEFKKGYIFKRIILIVNNGLIGRRNSTLTTFQSLSIIYQISVHIRNWRKRREQFLNSSQIRPQQDLRVPIFFQQLFRSNRPVSSSFKPLLIPVNYR